jgi:hypothetical protein
MDIRIFINCNFDAERCPLESIYCPGVLISMLFLCRTLLRLARRAAPEVPETVNFKCSRDQPTFGASPNQYLSLLDCRTAHIRKEYVPEDIGP